LGLAWYREIREEENGEAGKEKERKAEGELGKPDLKKKREGNTSTKSIGKKSARITWVLPAGKTKVLLCK